MKKKIFILCLSFLFIFSFASLALAKELYYIIKPMACQIQTLTSLRL